MATYTGIKAILQEFLRRALPSGMIVSFGGSSAPKGWLLCNGAAVSRTTYKNLFSAIGTSYGAGDGSTTFNLPDLRESVPVGAGTRGSGVSTHDIYGVGTFKDDKLKNHTHDYGGVTYSSGQHWHKFMGSDDNPTVVSSNNKNTSYANMRMVNSSTTNLNHNNTESDGSVYDFPRAAFQNSKTSRTIVDEESTGYGYTDTTKYIVATSFVTSWSGYHNHSYSGTTSSAGGGTQPTASNLA